MKLELKEFVLSSDVKIEDGLIRNAKVCGRVSRNKRHYSERALRDLVRLLQRKPVVYCDHEDGDRRVRDRWATIEDPHVATDGVRCNLRYLESHPVSASVKEDLQRGLGMFGLSINARGKGQKKGDIAMVESVHDLKSTDLVSEPATVHSLLEQENGEEAPAGDPFKMAVMGLLDDPNLDKDAFLAKVGELWDTLKGEGGAGGEGGSEEAPAQEQLREQVKSLLTEALKEMGITVAPKNGKVQTQKPKSTPTIPLKEQQTTVPTDPSKRRDWWHADEDVD